MSGRRDREERREQSLSAEAQVGSERRQRLIKLASAAVFLTVVAVAVLIVISTSESGGGNASDIQGGVDVSRLLNGIPQRGMSLGEPSAAAKLIEFGDLQCPVCKAYSEEVLPQIIEGQVRSGEARLEFSNYTIIGPESTPAGAAAIAAGRQGRGWNFVELFYRNQGAEDSGYVTEAFLTAIAKGAGVPDIAEWDRDRKSPQLLRQVAKTTAQAEELGFTGTPSFAIEGPRTQGPEAIGGAPSAETLESAIAKEAG